MKRLIFVCLICMVSIGWAGERALDHDGNLYYVYATPNQGISVLLLDIYTPDGAVSTMPVRGTKNFSGSLSPQIAYSNLAKRLFIVFAQEDAYSSDIVLVTYSPTDGFSAPLLLSDSQPGCRAVNPLVTLTNEVNIDSQNNRVWLQLLHVLWWEDGVRPGAVYMNLPVSFQFNGLDSSTRLRLDEILSPGMSPTELSALSPQLYQHPSLLVPQPGLNKVQILFFNTGLAQFQLVELSYSSDTGTLRDRAHFPDIGLRNTFALPAGFSPTQSVTSVVVDSGDLGFFSIEPEGVLYTLYCSGWTPARTLPPNLPPMEVENLLHSILSTQ